MVSHHLSGYLDCPLRTYSSICLGSLEHYIQFICCSQILLYCRWYFVVGVILSSSVISFINAYQLKMNNSQDTRARTGNLPKETLFRKSGNTGQKRWPRMQRPVAEESGGQLSTNWLDTFKELVPYTTELRRRTELRILQCQYVGHLTATALLCR
jgi:hypothetical protein